MNRKIDSFTLKLAAVVTMLIDHSAYVFAFFLSGKQYYLGRQIGRIAFPLFCFMLVEGYFHTRNKLRYLLRLMLLAAVSELPFDRVFDFEGGLFGSSQNVFFTLSLGLCAVMLAGEIDKWILNRLKKGGKEGERLRLVALNALLQLGVAVAAGISAYYMKTDYSYYGILLILMIYYFQHFSSLFKRGISFYGERKWKNMMAGAAIIVWFFYYDVTHGGMIESYGFPAVLLILFYNGKRGRYVIPAWFFYVFYPLHLLLLSFFSHYAFEAM